MCDKKIFSQRPQGQVTSLVNTRKESRIPIPQDLQKIEKEGILPNLFYEFSITLTPKWVKDLTVKPHSGISQEHRRDDY